jgi:predicted RNA-binding protein YlqC (UPF0109 family)
VSRAVVEYVSEWLLDHPEDMHIEEVEVDRGTMIEVSVHPDDMGKIIGKRGRIIQSIRTLARAASQRGGHATFVEVVE